MLKTNARAIALATTATALLAGIADATPIPVPNGGFETGTLSSWATGGGVGVTAVPNSGNYGAFSGCIGGGCFSTGPTGVTGNATISQSFNLQPGIYQVSYAEYNSSSTNNQFAVSLGNNLVRNSVNESAHTYQDFSHISAVSGGPTTLAFGFRNDPAYIYLDDVTLELIDDGFGNNIGAASQTVALQASLDFIERIQDRFGHAGSPMELASAGEVMVADASGGGYYSRGNGKYRAFIEVFGGHGEWDDSDTTSNRRGITAGFEFAAHETLALGAAVAFGSSDFKTETLLTTNRGDADELLGAVYLNWSPRETPLYFSALVGYGESDNDLKRTSLLGFGSVIAQDVNATQWFGSAEIGFDWNMTSSFTLTPFARIDGASLEQDGYAEGQIAGATLVPATVASQDADALRSALGARIAFNVGRAEVKAKAAWAHNFEQDRFVTFSETTGPVTFVGTTGAATPDEDSALVGASVNVPVSRGASIYAAYNGDLGSTQNIHSGEVGLRVTW